MDAMPSALKWAMFVMAVLGLVGLIVTGFVWVSGEFNDIIIALDRHEEFGSGEHLDLLRSSATSQDDLSYRIGVHQGQHYSCP